MPVSGMKKDFNPRSPCGERRKNLMYPSPQMQFQSTLPVRGATTQRQRSFPRPSISIHAPRAGSDCGAEMDGGNKYISIHAPRAGSDQTHTTTKKRWSISIHAPRAGSDPAARRVPRPTIYFNPRSPCGERRVHGKPARYCMHFNPRSPCGERQQAPFSQ